MQSDPTQLSIGEASRLIAAGELTASELTQATLQRLAWVQPRYQPFVAIQAAAALEQARQLDGELRAGRSRGPLHGIPIGVKDIIDVADLPTRCGSRSREDAPPAASDADVVARLRRAGAVILGKTVTHEFAAGATSPPARCTWDASCIPGGSSGGSAVAVSAGVASAALGTDTGSSVRSPAALNGVVGVKPTYGRVSREGVVPNAWSCDHVGLMTRSVRDAALLLPVMSANPAGPPVDAADLDARPGVEGLRLGVPENYFFDDVESTVRAAVEEAIHVLEALGARIVRLSIPHVERSYSVALVCCFVEGAAYHRRQLETRASGYSEDVRDFFRAGELIFGTAYLDAQRVRTLIIRSLERAFAEHALDALLTPTVPFGAVPAAKGLSGVAAGEDPVLKHYARLTCTFNLTGAPALSVPCGFDVAHHPIGLQIAARPYDERTILRLGNAYQRATGWHELRPPLEGEAVHAGARA